MTAFFHVLDDSRCDGITASIAISRRDGSDVRNQTTQISRVNGLVTAYPRFTTGWQDAGTWAIRQIAVKKDGVTAIRKFDPASSPGIHRSARAIGNREAARGVG